MQRRWREISRIRKAREISTRKLEIIQNARSMKVEVVRQEMARVDVDTLGINKQNRLEWVSLIQMTIISTKVGKNPLEEME